MGRLRRNLHGAGRLVLSRGTETTDDVLIRNFRATMNQVGDQPVSANEILRKSASDKEIGWKCSD
jgi:hypothetical protein